MCFQGNNKQLKNIIFDLGGVILNLDYDETLREFQKHVPIDKETFYGSKKQLDFFSDYEIGKISTLTLKQKFNSFYHSDISSIDFDRAWNAMLFDFPKERIEFIEKLSASYKIFLLSNINDLHLHCVHERYKFLNRADHFENLFEKVYYSHEIGLRKPNKEIFNLVLEENNLNPSETLFIDDSLQHIEGAKRVGLNVYHLVKPNDIKNLNIVAI